MANNGGFETAKRAIDAASSFHPLPWKVAYGKRFRNWHDRCSPVVVDADDNLVCEVTSDVDHPGYYDAKSDTIAQAIVLAANEAGANEV